VTSVTVKESVTTTTSRNTGWGWGWGWFGWGNSGTKTTTYTYTISTKQTNVTVKKIKYYLKKDDEKITVSNNKITSDKDLESFYIDVKDSNDNVTTWFYDGTTTEKVDEKEPK